MFSFVAFGLDIIIEFFTAYYQHGNLVTKKSKIAKHYFKTYFPYDMIAVMMFGIRMSFRTEEFRWVFFFFYFKLPSFLKLDYQFEEFVLLHSKGRTLYSIGKIVLLMLFWINLFGCIYFMIGMKCVELGYNSWLLNDSIFGEVYTMNPQN